MIDGNIYLAMSINCIQITLAIRSVQVALVNCGTLLPFQDFYDDNSDLADLDGEADSHGLFQQLSPWESRFSNRIGHTGRKKTCNICTTDDAR